MTYRNFIALGMLCVSLACLGATPGMSSHTLTPDVRAFLPVALADRNRKTHKPWAVLDKKNARIFMFDGGGILQASSPVLLGAAIGDDSVPGIGDRKIADIRPFEKTTPAGRFQTEPGTNLQGEDIVWVDYDAAISMHRVRRLKGERRLERLASSSASDNRISYGCINVPASFYDQWLEPTFGSHAGILYVLPETRAAHAQFRTSTMTEVRAAKN